MPLPPLNLGDFSRIAKPTLDQLYGCRSITVHSDSVRLGRSRVTINELVATRGCFVDGHRRLFQVEVSAGRVNLGPHLSGPASEILCWAPTRAEVIAKAEGILADRKRHRA